MTTARLLVLGFILSLLPVRAAMALEDELHILTERLPPYAFVENGMIKGISVDMLEEMMARAKLPYRRRDITVVPWARGYAQAQNRPNTILFSTVRSADREKLFQWIGPISVTQTVIWARRDKNIRIEKPSDLNQYRVGVSRDSVGHEWLLTNGVDANAIVPIVQENGGALLLSRGRVDLWIADATMGRWELQKLKLSPVRFEVVYTLMEKNLYYAAHPDSDPAIIDRLQTALDSMKADKTHAAILSRYKLPGNLD